MARLGEELPPGESSNQRLQSRKHSHFLGTVTTHGADPSLVTPFQILQPPSSCLPRGPALPRRARRQGVRVERHARCSLPPGVGQGPQHRADRQPQSQVPWGHRRERHTAGRGLPPVQGTLSDPQLAPAQGKPSPLARDNQSPSACREGTARPGKRARSVRPLPALPVLTPVTKTPA